MAEILINNKPYYYNERSFVYEGDTIDKQVALEFLLIIKKELDSNNIRFFLNCGTLLGAYRDHDFISHDFDMDLGIFQEDVQQFLNLIPTFEKKGVSLCREWGGIFYSFIYKDLICDFNVFYKAKFPYSIYYYGVSEMHFAPKKHLNTLMKYEFMGKTFSIPSDPEGYLKFLYGKDWRIPQKGKGAESIPKWMVLEKIYRRIKRKTRYLKAKYITHTDFK